MWLLEYLSFFYNQIRKRGVDTDLHYQLICYVVYYGKLPVNTRS
jgi:hypothetical protein